MVCMNCANEADKSPATYFEAAMHAARLAEISARDEKKRAVGAAVSYIIDIVGSAGMLNTPKGKQRKAVELMKGYCLQLVWMEHEGRTGYVLHGNGRWIASEYGLLESAEGNDEFIAAVRGGMIQEITAFAASNKQGKIRRGSIPIGFGDD